ncbi:Stk1 family PASTA domain-containing Ser/Thr kinase [Lachnobacterium bovis]|uniref:non-specific serine/threonine protein kinase n=1 Tax=Lachnobacterium bovis TaxID=140626 RepID=A0A1H9PCG5_9FIRM|nr:Stk1 family PASTA domain-containing Ser/Thr kinase [Lachnobacterium bovis]SER45870.1 serine/threonine protein kinase [Lachnobacterium bovis]
MLNEGMYLSDRYEILEKIGAGGMSDVYKAKDHVLDRFVAVKVLKAEFSEDMNFVSKFRTEAQSAASLEHPNIVNIYDVGSEEGLHYIVMEYIEGITLKTYIEKKGCLTYKEAVSIAIQIAKGIEAAHNKNITHRDIKPQNIIISTEGKVKVTDFGIARAASTNTVSADVMGSVHYASPEQARNGFVDGRSDIYSLGIVMYEMVTGRVPFDGDTTVSVALQHLQDEMVSPSEYAKDLPISIEKIIQKCAQKNPDRRYQNIEELTQDLRKSLVTPNEDFVQIVPIDENAKTKVISSDEVKQINEGIKQEPIANDNTIVQKEHIDEDELSPEEDEEEGSLNPKMDKAITIMGIITAVIIVIVIIYLVLNMLGFVKFGGNNSTTEKKPKAQSEATSAKQEVTMIDVTGRKYEDAETELKKLGLNVEVSERRADTEIEEGCVIESDPKAGEKVKAGSTVKLVVCEKEEVTVPSVIGKSESDASRILMDAGLVVEKKYEYSDSVPGGKVIRQTPSSGKKTQKNNKVIITISQGVESVTVPSVVGISKDQAVEALSGLGLDVSIRQEYSSTVSSGNVISQSIQGGRKSQKGAAITIVVSMGKKETEQKTYTYSYDVVLQKPANVSSVTINLRDYSTGNIVATASSSSFTPEKTHLNFSKKGITSSTGTGKLEVTWKHTDGTTSTEGSSSYVTFTREQ